MTGLLDKIRVLDLTTSRGEIAGRLLADLGADVVKIECAYNNNSKRLPPFTPNGESLYWSAYGMGKKCVEVDLDDAAAINTLLQLATYADVLIESFDAKFAYTRGIGYDQLSELNPRLIYAAVTPFGQDGPKSHWPTTDLTLEAAGGRLSIQGDPDRPPLPVGYPQAFLHAGAQLAADIVVALNERELSGLGQFLDLSAQETMWWTLMAAQGSPVCNGTDPPGAGDDRDTRRRGQGTQMAAAKDGLVTIAPGASPLGTKTMFSFAIEEARELGDVETELLQYDWNNWIPHYRAGEITPQHLQSMNTLVAEFVARRTKLELVQWALENNLRLGPLNSTKDLLTFPQFVDREFFCVVDGTPQPANWVRFSRTPLQHSPQRNISISDISWSATPCDHSGDAPRPGNAFEGLKVADFSWVAAGPTVAKCLADHGATVVKVESQTRPDLSRTLPPFIDGQPGLNRSYWSFLYATSKLSLQCNLATDAGRRLARKLCDWADVVVESFSPGTMERFGLDYNSLSADRPDLIVFSTSMLGQTGPFSAYAGYGQQASGFCGFHNITGWPDRDPCGVATPYTDVIAPKFGIAALAAAILERRRTGLGQHIDLAQAECSMMFLAPVILDEVVNGKTATAQGFDSTYACPQGVYACEGTQRFIAISAETADHWRNLRHLVPDLRSYGDEFDKFERRWASRRNINAAIEKWTKSKEAFALEAKMIAEGIPASVVMRPTDVFVDPQIEARKIKQTIFHKECGDVIHWGFPTRFSAKETMVRNAPPCMGEHNGFVMRELLQLSDDEIRSYHEESAIE